MSGSRSTTEALGQSGASVRITFDEDDKPVAIKTGGRIVSEQATWLMTHEAPGLVNVEHTSITGLQTPEKTSWQYSMEVLAPIPFRSTHPRGLGVEIATILMRDVWVKSPEVDTIWEQHHEYLMDRIGAYVPEHREPIMDSLVRVMDASYAGKLVTCLIHGDPTFANTMLRGQQHVLIDPIPASGHVPSLRVVDLGKILQSMMGYETRRFGWYLPVNMTTGEMNEFLTLFTENDEEIFAAWYFAVFHFLRLMPYTPPEHYDAMMELLEHAIQQLA